MVRLIFFIFVMAAPCMVAAQDGLHPGFTGEFRGIETGITHTLEDGTVVHDVYTSKIGRFSRTEDAIPISGSLARPGASIQDIPTVGLAAEHWWTSFELLMKGQREYAECVAAIEEYQRRRGECLLTDTTCNPLAGLIITLKEYWVPFGVVFNSKHGTSKPPRKQDFIDHFEAGIFGVNMIIQHRNVCRAVLAWERLTNG